jgi:hypothetical protein
MAQERAKWRALVNAAIIFRDLQRVATQVLSAIELVGYKTGDVLKQVGAGFLLRSIGFNL